MKTISDSFIKSTAFSYDLDEHTVLRLYNKNCDSSGELNSENFYMDLEDTIDKDSVEC